MEHDTKTPPYMTSDPNSFAQESAQLRWPKILTKVIDDVFRATQAHTDPEKIKEGRELVSTIASLKYHLQHNRELTPLDDDGGEDIALYNEELSKIDGGHAKWHNVPWLFSECYLYRRLHSYFAKTQHWKNYDPFAAEKNSTFQSSLPSVLELATHYKDLVEAVKLPSGDAEKDELIFKEMMEISLWGNATDLSLLTSLTYEDIQKLQGAEARKKAEENILVNDLSRVYSILSAAQKEGKAERRVEIVLDNAGFELYVDLALAGYLLHAGLATEVVLHPKNMPWFVSDVIPADFQNLLNILKEPKEFFKREGGEEATGVELTEKHIADLQFLFSHWAGLHADGKLRLRSNKFWTLPGSYWRLPYLAPDLWEDFKAAEVVIYKGDLNYRKLTGDAMWPATASWEEAIGPLGGKCGVRTLALRTCKADVVVGLKEGDDERLCAEGGGEVGGKRKWAWGGKWAVCQFWDGKA